jgi:hypothetical protein
MSWYGNIKVALKITRDNPGGVWLESERKRAEDRGTLGALTAQILDVLVPVDILIQIEGTMGEHLRIDEDDERVRELSESIKSEGLTSPPFISVDMHGDAKVREGNHRIRAAKLIGLKSIPVQIGYYCGGEDEDGILSVDRVKSF